MANNGKDGRVLDRLFSVVDSRRTADPDVSYTAKLLSRGRRRIARKVGEEAVEVVVAALSQPAEDVVSESADLLYHLVVLWASLGLKPEAVWAELARREAMSGNAEKASRSKAG